MARILIVEDDNYLGREISLALESGGYEVFWAKDAASAWQVLDSQTIDLIFMDILLPGDKDGYAILKDIKDNPKYREIPVVMLSNLGQMSEVDKAIEYGAQDYLIKSNIDLDDLVDLTKSKFLHK